MSKLVLSPDEGTLVWLGGIGAKYKLAGNDTNGSFTIVEHPVEPGTLVPPHTHSHED